MTTPTTLLDREAPIVHSEAIAIVDAALVTFGTRSLVAGHEVVDQLLDLRNALVASLQHDVEANRADSN